MPRRPTNPYYMQIDVEAFGVEKTLCFLGAFLALGSRRVLAAGARAAYGKACGGEDCVDVVSVTREALAACGIDAERVEATNLMPTFYNTPRFLGVLVPAEGGASQARLCEWLMRAWDARLRARLAPLALSLGLAYVACRGVFERLAVDAGLAPPPRRAAYTLLGAVLLLNLLVWYGEAAEAVPPAVLVGLGLLAGNCDGRCVEVLYEHLSREELVRDARSVERKLRGMCRALRGALEVVEGLASRGARIPGYCVQGGVALDPDTLVKRVAGVVERRGRKGCIEAVEVCRGARAR